MSSALISLVTTTELVIFFMIFCDVDTLVYRSTGILVVKLTMWLSKSSSVSMSRVESKVTLAGASMPEGSYLNYSSPSLSITLISS